MNVAICTPSTGSVKATYTTSLLGLVMHYLNVPVPGRENEEKYIGYYLLVGSHIAQQRQSLIDDALKSEGVTHILFIDDDMGFGPECLNTALSRKKPIVLANYRRKTPPWQFTARFLDPEGRAVEIPTHSHSTGLEEITFGGFGFCLIEVEVLAKMKRPMFLTQWIDYQDLYSTEDFPFFQAIHRDGISKVYLDHDLSKRMMHVGDYQYKYDTAPYVQPK